MIYQLWPSTIVALFLAKDLFKFKVVHWHMLLALSFITFGYNYFLGGGQGVGMGLISALTIGAFGFPLVRAKVFTIPDLMSLVVVGLALSIPQAIRFYFLTILAAGFVAVIIAIRERRIKNVYIPFSLPLILGWAGCLIFNLGVRL